MPRRAGPSARSRRLAQTLRKIRTEKGATAAEVGKALGMSGSKINRIETCEIGIYLGDLERLLDFYQLADKRRVELLDIARHAEQRSWLRTRKAHFPADWQTWSDFEHEATGLRVARAAPIASKWPLAARSSGCGTRRTRMAECWSSRRSGGRTSWGRWSPSAHRAVRFA